VTDFGKLLTYREQLEQAVERAEVAQEQTEILRQEAVGARELAEIAQEQAENANRVKGQFLSQMSHELRTPMNGVIGSLDLINWEKLDSEEQATH